MPVDLEIFGYTRKSLRKPQAWYDKRLTTGQDVTRMSKTKPILNISGGKAALGV